MNVIGFDPVSRMMHGRRVRALRFATRSMLPVSAACVVANGARQTLADLLGSPVTLRLLEPVLPSREAWAHVCDGALMYAVRGEQSDAAFVLRHDDALALAGAALGERVEDRRPLSVIESALISRMAGAMSGALAAVCGMQRAGRVSKVSKLEGFTTYFELIVEQPVSARIGVALSREPRPAVHPAITFELLRSVDLELSAELAHTFLPAASVMGLRPGQVIAFDTALEEAGILRAGERVLARGDCGQVETRRVVCLR